MNNLIKHTYFYNYVNNKFKSSKLLFSRRIIFIVKKVFNKFERCRNTMMSKFLFERSIVFDPKHFNSYLYLAKIYKYKKESNKKKKKTLETVHY